MKLLTNNEINEIIGKNRLFENHVELIAKLGYLGGIKEFDNILKGETITDYGATIHLVKHPKGLQIKLAETFCSHSIALEFNKISRIIIEHKNSIIKNKDKSVIGRAAVGELLLGPLGAIVGALSGIKNSQEPILPDSILTIFHNSENIEKGLFFSCKKSNLIDTKDFFYSIGIEIQEIKESVYDPNTSNKIDELERLAKLKSEGNISIDEFNELKKKLL